MKIQKGIDLFDITVPVDELHCGIQGKPSYLEIRYGSKSTVRGAVFVNLLVHREREIMIPFHTYLLDSEPMLIEAILTCQRGKVSLAAKITDMMKPNRE